MDGIKCVVALPGHLLLYTMTLPVPCLAWSRYFEASNSVGGTVETNSVQ